MLSSIAYELDRYGTSVSSERVMRGIAADRLGAGAVRRDNVVSMGLSYGDAYEDVCIRWEELDAAGLEVGGVVSSAKARAEFDVVVQALTLPVFFRNHLPESLQDRLPRCPVPLPTAWL